MNSLVVRAKGGTYINRMVATTPLVYFPLNESSGTAAINRGTLGTPANGTYTGVDLANLAGPKAPFLHPYFDGVNDYVNIDTAALDGGYNGQLGTVAFWYKVYNAAIWTDGLMHWFFQIDRAGAHIIQLLKYSTNNMLNWTYYANSVNKSVTDTSHADTNWHCMSITWSLAADQMKAYLDGVQIGSTQTGLGTWAPGNLDHAVIGAMNTVPSNPHKGWLAHMALWTRVLTATELLALV